MSAYHGFDPEVAAEVGVNAAVIYKNIVFWCSKNAANLRNEHEGRFYTYNSVNAFSEMFPYLTVKQIRTALELLESSGYIGSANLNKTAMDRTKWYCILRQMDLPSRANGNAPEGRAIPDNKPDNKPDTKSARDPVTRDKAIDISQEDLDRIWNAYPDDGKVSSAPGNLVFWLRDALVTLGSVPAVLAAVVAYARACRKHDSRPKAIHNFLTDRPLLLRYAPPPDAPEPGEAARWDALCEVYARREDWEGEGPPPGHPGCRVPDDIQRRYGFEPKAAA